MEENNTKEVNLLQLINIFFKWLKKILTNGFDFLGYLAQLNFRHKIIFISTILLCFIYGIYLSRPSVRVYKAGATAMLYGIETQTAKEVSKQLETSISSNKLFSLATKLSIPDSVAENIVGIQSFFIIDYLKDGVPDMVDFKNNHSLTDTLNIQMRDRFYLQVEIKDISQLAQIQSSILNYFNNNTVMKRQFINKKNELIQRIKICDVESKRVDSLAKVSYFKDSDKQLQFDKNKLLIGEQRKQLFYDDLLRLHDIKNNAETRLVDFNQPMNLPSGFVINSSPENGSMKYGLEGILIGFLIALLLSALTENINKITTYLNRK